MQKSITVADAMLQTAEAVQDMGKKMGLKLDIFDIYNKETCKELALIANFLIQQVKKAGKCEVEITKS